MSEARDPAQLSDDALDICAREPIHTPGSIQPHGCLVICSSPDWRVRHASQNLESFLGKSAAAALGRPAAELLGEQGVHAIRNLLHQAQISTSGERFFQVSTPDWSQNFDIALHRRSDRVSIELEPSAKARLGADPLSLVKNVMTRLQNAEDLAAFCNQAARQLKLITGFARVMVYRFAEDGSGEVIAEAKRPDMPPFLGLHYPATDIPPQARRLYEANPIRTIADVDAVQSPILPQTDEAGQPVDMSFIDLRSVSPIHLQYLRNMGVAASMSLSILRGGRLWGLFACHHDKPHVVGAEVRSACELFCQLFSLQIEAKERAEAYVAEREGRRAIDGLISQLPPDAALPEALSALRPVLAQLMDADGLALISTEGMALHGLTPRDPVLAELVRRLNSRGGAGAFATDHIADLVPEAQGDAAAGLLAVPISRMPRDYLIFFRRELARTVTWAGRPQKPATVEEQLTPRRSFEAWTEVVRGRSRPWLRHEIDLAEALRVSLLEIVLRHVDHAESERRAAQERQEVLIAELNHRVKNLLALVRSLARGGQDPNQSLNEFIDGLLGRLEALAAAHDQATGEARASLDLAVLVNNELAPYARETGPHVALSGPNVAVEKRAIAVLSLVLHEMATNSAKYGALSVPAGALEIEWRVTAAGVLELAWRERGGPPVLTPERRGFGSTLIERTIPHELKGEAEIRYEPLGVTARFVIPADCVRPLANDDASPGAAQATSSGRSPRARARPESFTALLVEDAAILALDFDDMLREAGASDVTLAGTVAEALEAIERAPPDVALLDVNLGDESSLQVARRLKELGRPFVFSTGYGEQQAVTEEFPDAPQLSKPFPARMLVAALDEAFQRR